MKKLDLAESVLAEIQTTANRVARKGYHSRATSIVKGHKAEIIKSVSFGNRKFTTGEYVPNAYMNNFGWKNTYYQAAECIVSIPPELWAKKEKWEKYLNEENN